MEKRVETSLQSSLPRRISFCDFSVGQDRRGERISLFDGVQEVREIQARRIKTRGWTSIAWRCDCVATIQVAKLEHRMSIGPKYMIHLWCWNSSIS